MPVYGNGWERVKQVLTDALGWLVKKLTDKPDDPPPTKE
jgi:hypothetical protein